MILACSENEPDPVSHAKEAVRIAEIAAASNTAHQERANKLLENCRNVLKQAEEYTTKEATEQFAVKREGGGADSEHGFVRGPFPHDPDGGGEIVLERGPDGKIAAVGNHFSDLEAARKLAEADMEEGEVPQGKKTNVSQEE